MPAAELLSLLKRARYSRFRGLDLGLELGYRCGRRSELTLESGAFLAGGIPLLLELACAHRGLFRACRGGSQLRLGYLQPPFTFRTKALELGIVFACEPVELASRVPLGLLRFGSCMAHELRRGCKLSLELARPCPGLLQGGGPLGYARSASSARNFCSIPFRSDSSRVSSLLARSSSAVRLRSSPCRCSSAATWSCAAVASSAC